jgi:hypothetical protein
MAESEALARCPDLELRDRDLDRELVLLSRAAEALMAFGPEVEVQPPNTLYVEYGRSLRALAETYASEEAVGAAIVRLFDAFGHDVAVVLAPSVDLGRTLVHEPAQQGRSGLQVVPAGEEGEWLAGRPVSTLLWTDVAEDPEGRLAARLQEVAADLALLGVERVEDLLRLTELPHRFCDVEARLRARARGTADRPLRPYRPAERLVEDFELDRGTENVEPLLFIGKRLVDRLTARLNGLSRSVVGLQLRLRYEPGIEAQLDFDQIRPRSSKREAVIDLAFARPTRDPDVMLAVLKERLLVPGFVVSLRLEAVAAAYDPGAQLDLFNHFAQRVEEAAGLISRLQAALGPEAVFTPELVDTHRPERGWHRIEFDIERAMAEPRPTRPSRSLAAAPMLPFSGEPETQVSLPKVDEHLSVIEPLAQRPEVAKKGGADLCRAGPLGPWPKPVPRRAEDEPPPPLPPRPTLLGTPRRVGERAFGTRWRPDPAQGEERLEAEWWTAAPLRRVYRVHEAEDGRRMWFYVTPDGETYIHGMFD